MASNSKDERIIEPMTLKCDWAEQHPGIPGVDGLKGDDPFTVSCDNDATGILFFPDDWTGPEAHDPRNHDHVTVGHVLVCDQHSMEMAHELKNDGLDWVVGAQLFGVKEI